MGLFFNNQDIANAGVTEKAVLYSRSRFSWGLSEIGATKPDGARLLREAPAAFGRLCVETMLDAGISKDDIQPPSGGCVLKPCQLPKLRGQRVPAAFGRLCVETQQRRILNITTRPAAFGRLCVEIDDLYRTGD